MNGQRVLSVGLDVGTTTSQMVVSRLTVSNRARGGYMPQMQIDQREVLYESVPELTPLTSPDEVDVELLTKFVKARYEEAGISPAEVTTGAVIITGETARTKNAEAILQGLSSLAGDFVVTVAGPNVESQMAARGSGAAGWSAENYATVVNVDIGGGSANAAVFRSGEHIASSAMMVGGRQAVVDPQTGVLTHLAPSGVAIAKAKGINLRVGQRADERQLWDLAHAMADLTVDLCLGITTPLGDEVALSPGFTVDDKVSAYFISGGVGALYYDEAPARTQSEWARYGDIGPMFAQALRENPRWRELPVLRPAQTLRATVLGAASQQVTLSGSTIWAESKFLPLKNLPVIEPDLSESSNLTDAPAITKAVDFAITRWDRENLAGCAISVALPKGLRYEQISAVSDGLVQHAKTRRDPGSPLVLVLEEDYAQVLGQTIRGKSNGLPLIVVDQVGLGEGDFIDIGEPMFDGRVVPVSVKTLIFYSPDTTSGAIAKNSRS